jgi:hypothetical protein
VSVTSSKAGYLGVEQSEENKESILFAGDEASEGSGIEDDVVGHSCDLLMDSSPQVVVMCGKKISKRTLGVCAAAFCGIWGGSIMVPMHFAPNDDRGMGYTISFAIGASLVNLALWLLRYLFNVCKVRSFQRAYHILPSFHLRKMWFAGGLSGTLWSIANFFSLLSVKHLGEGVGYSVTQSSMIVAGLWGIFYYREIVGAGMIGKWFASVFMTVSGILLLSYEHHEGIGGHGTPFHGKGHE